MIERFRTAEDDVSIAAAWRAMQDQMTDAEVKAALAGVDTDDGTLRADLALLAPDLDIMPTGHEGPGDFEWVRLAAAKRRSFENADGDPSIDTWEHWHTGHLGEHVRGFWRAMVRNDYAFEMSLHHLVALSCAGQHPQMANDGIPFEENYWAQFTAIDITRRVLEMRRPRLSDFPPEKLSWADRGLVWVVYELMHGRWIGSSTQARQRMFHEVVDSDIAHGWLGGFTIAPPGWEDGRFGNAGWIPCETIREQPPVGPEMPPDMDCDQWAGQGVCMVRVHRRTFSIYGWHDREQAMVDALGLPTLVILPDRAHVQGRSEPIETEANVYLFLPGVRPMGFGRFDLPQTEGD